MNKREFVKTLTVGTLAATAHRALEAAEATLPAPSPAPAPSDAAALHVATRATAPWQAQPPPAATRASRSFDLEVTDDLATTWDGFGGCFNELGWRALQHLPAAERAGVLDRLFRPDGELGFEFCRLPIGANDYAEDWYSYAETPDDFDLSHFSVERDRRAILPFVKEALKRQPDLKLFASPWSPPTWLKNPPVYNSGRLRTDPRHLDTYARYFVKYVQAYANEGVSIHQIHVQNEPTSSQKFPSCVMTGDELRVLIGRHIGPAFADARCPAELWLGTLNGPDTNQNIPDIGFNAYAFTVMEDPAARPHVRGISYQWAGKQAVARTRHAYPDVPVIQSENECGDGGNTWHYAWYVADLFQHYLTNDVSAYVYWNMVLEPGGRSTWGWAQNSLLTVNPATGTLIVNPEYHIMRHYSGFIRRGDRRCRCERPWSANAVAFRRRGGGTTVVLRNPLREERSLAIACSGRNWRVSVAPESLNTIVLP